MLTIGSLFSGIGGFELGLEWSGLGPVLWQVEQDEWCRGVLARHWPDAERFCDVRDVGSAQLRPVDLICGGFPCQDVSSAGAGAGLAGRRSGLWREFARISAELRPSWAIVENVASGAPRWVDVVVQDLGRLGYETLPVPLSAGDVGAPHERARVFVVAKMANIDGEREPARPVYAPMASPPGYVGDTGRRRHTGWPTKLELVPSIHGVPGRVRRALGNSVVPQCAEAIGWVVRELHAGTNRL